MLMLNGTSLLPDISGALIWPETRTIVVADLHLEKGSSYAVHGQSLPPYDTTATLKSLHALIARIRPERVVCLGDSFHDAAAPDRLHEGDIASLRALTSTTEWIWVAGNHDPAPPEDLGGHVMHDFCVGPLTFRHIPAKCPDPGEIAGHFHPKAGLVTRGRYIVRPCFVTDGQRLILPAFGTFTGGLNVCDPAISDLLAPDFDVIVRGQDRLHRFASRQLVSRMPPYAQWR